MSLFDLPPIPDVPVNGENRGYPVRRIFCVGRNYADHAREMGQEPDLEAPFYFTKTPAALCLTGATVPYAPGTSDLHHEMELVVALGASVFRADREAAANAVYAYACGLDMTRRDRQQDAKDKRRPWDLGKDFENAAVIAPLSKTATLPPLGPQSIRLTVNGDVRQEAKLDQLLHDVPAVIAHLSGYYHLGPGDLIYTGTPAGVGAVEQGDVLKGDIDGLDPIELTIGAPEGPA
ncbi:fumarylacetoacetate hydrolase family protein [Pseudooceanicola batsensis HTCC2597]|uniref:Fumarylacetoacetate hydrolase family protein n=1 Tax=Pseudooceanicola batsensis (strain ATCC BAA-863 / DSM 15984 / KCTC 12145 / HTCC2597) TaxID=252305 RepID=A3TW44_PSEBH|nr:fumarylacetoacetate hydrolase family protein [Pseudooceanicola batsensis HTCC2597]